MNVWGWPAMILLVYIRPGISVVVQAGASTKERNGGEVIAVMHQGRDEARAQTVFEARAKLNTPQPVGNPLQSRQQQECVRLLSTRPLRRWEVNGSRVQRK